ncbi:MAG: methionine gamma-lyase family protein [Clostridiales bacterium]|jgi:cystathionine beta-lyase family protein involved in aluminum resistance|nr:methionine gamma-lyase family protein [Clostridiales bacterium]
MTNRIERLISEVETALDARFRAIESRALYLQEKALNAFRNNRVAARHFAPTNGYGYDDAGRDTLCRIYAEVFEAQSAVVSPHIINGTHAIALALFGVLRPGGLLLSVTGTPYDTLKNVISGKNNGSLADFGVKFRKVELADLGDGQAPDYAAVTRALREKPPAAVFIQRSRGYAWRRALTLAEIEKLIACVKSVCDVPVIVDNCYGEFVEDREPTAVGADLIAGSLIKNPGGGLAPSGGYIAGKAAYVDAAAGRLTVPGIGMAAGSYDASYRPFYQGFFMAPHTVSQAMKTAALFCGAFSRLGYETLPKTGEGGGDIIASVKFAQKEELLAFCREIQKSAPVDGFVTPEPWDMPGYNHQVIMAAGTFVQGASIELSADSPVKEPYIAYLQGSLTYEHGKIALKNCLNAIDRERK